MFIIYSKTSFSIIFESTDLIITLLILINDRNNETTDLEDEKLNQSLKNPLQKLRKELLCAK